MKLIRDVHNLKPDDKGCVATIGNFDGLHLGHQKIIERTIEQARQLDIPALLITFEPLPQEYFSGNQAPARLLRLREKLMLLESYEIDRVLCLRFNHALASLPAQTFVEEILIKKLGVRWLIVGDDFRFGYERQGNLALLKKMGRTLGFTVESTSTVLVADERVGSSRVRVALSQGNLELAEQLLGRPYSICGRVIHGDKRGRKLGFPTANIPLRRKVIPLRGVFAVEVHGIGTEKLPAVANIGKRPTVHGRNYLLEIHLLHAHYELYGRFLRVDILHKIRDEQHFDSLEELQLQIDKDVNTAQEFFRLEQQ